MDKRDLKTRHGDRDAVANRHRRRNEAATRAKRDEAKKRNREANHPLTFDEVEQMIPTLDIAEFMSVDQSKTLSNIHRILSNGVTAQPFFGPSSLYPNYNGPYLFVEPPVLTRLVHLFKQGNQMAAECLTNVAGHLEFNRWVRILIELGLVADITSFLDRSDIPLTFRKECWWILGNITFDTAEARNFVCQSCNPVELMAKQPLDDKEIFTEVVVFLKAIFDRSPIPGVEYFTQFAPILQQAIQLASRDEAIGSFVGTMLKNVIRQWPVQAHQWMVHQPWLMESVLHLCKESNLRYLYLEFVAKLCLYEACHEILVVQYSVVPILMEFAWGADVTSRVASLQGLRNLGMNSASFPLLANDAWMNRVFAILGDSDMWIVRRELYWLITTLIVKAPADSRPSFYLYLFQQQIIPKLVDLLQITTEYELALHNLVALESLWMANREFVPLFVNCGGVEHLERLSLHESPQLRNGAERLLKTYFP